jgi:hypothetical protein
MPCGKILQGLVAEGIAVGISSRSLGSIKEHSDGTLIVQDDLQIKSFDVVLDPSTGVTVKTLMESVSRYSHSMSLPAITHQDFQMQVFHDFISNLKRHCR